MGCCGSKPSDDDGVSRGGRKTSLTEKDVLQFEKDGYIILRGAVPQDQVEAALRVIDEAFASGNHGISDVNPTDVVPKFDDNVSKHPDVVGVLRDTPLYDMCEQLIGRNQAWQPQRAQVALREPSKYWKGLGWDLNTTPDPDGWHIDGGSGTYAYVGSPFTMLVGVCLSPGQDVDNNQGQFLAWPGSHYPLHDGVAERVREGRIKDPHAIFAGTREERPDIGAPIRCLLRPGDAVLAHQRLGHCGGPNLGNNVRKNLYLRVMNRQHDSYLSSGELLNGSVWTEYAGVREVLRKNGREV